MARKKLTHYFLYRRRITLAYMFIFAALIVLLTIALFIPGGLTPAEQASSVAAMNTNTIGVNAPYYLLQKLSLSQFGLSVFAIKLPSIVLAALLGVSLFLLLRRWLTLAIAVFGALIIFASTMFLTLAGTGSPMIMFVLLPALLLFLGTRVLAHDRGLVVYAILLLITIATALLTPTMIYLVVLALGLALFNPHVRYGFRRLPGIGRIILVLGFLLAIAPLAYVLIMHPATWREIFAIPATLTIGDNLATLLALLGSFLNPGLVSGVPAPMVGLATIGLTGIGIYRIVRAIYTARAQFIAGWSAIALILAIIDPGYGVLLYLPIILLAALGLSQLAAIWYRTFPLNPYARVSALLPIGVLIAGIVIGSTLRYVNTMLYASGSAELYSKDLTLIQQYNKANQYYGFTLAVSDPDVAFYRHLGSNVKVVSLDDAKNTKGAIVASEPLPDHGIPSRIITDSRANGADRFYVYR